MENIMLAIQKQEYNSFFSKLKDYNEPKRFYFYLTEDKKRKPPKVTKEDIERLLKTDYDETLEGKEVSKEDYWEYYYNDTPYEWKNGRLEVKPLADLLSSLVNRWFSSLLDDYKETNEFQIVANEIGFEMNLKSGDQVRKPDIAIIAPDSLQMDIYDRRYDGIFDLCIEFLSDSKKSEINRDIIEKKAEYEEASVKEYFIIDRKKKHSAFYRLENNVYKNIESDDGVVKSEVLKGFQFRTEHLYSRPNLIDLVDDPVYKNYICPHYQESQEEKKRAEKAEKQIQEEKERAEKQVQEEKKRAEKAEKQIQEEKERAEKQIQEEKKRAEKAEKQILKEKECSMKYKKMLEDLGVEL